MKIQARKQHAGAVVKIGLSRQVVIPKKFHDQLGLEPGDYLEVEVKEDRLVMTPKALIEKRLAEGLEDVRSGRIHGPFRSSSALLRSLHGSRKKRIS